MKKCSSCGAVQQDDRIFCIDCGEKLPEKLSTPEESRIAEDIAETIDKQYDKSDNFAVDLSMKLAAGVDIAATVFSLVAMLLSSRPDKYYVIIAFIWYAVSFAEALFPELLWTVSKLGDLLRYDNIDDLEPSFIYTKIRRILVWAAPVIGIAITSAYLFL